ncbi:MAG: hypothetical protein EHM35_16750 [Planctomycetaceae bacterium]|nr:MAG: hypothetical protein EHM35_16750 [Planctomycetaceae bacterium]
MLDRGYDLLMWHMYNQLLRQREKNRLARQAQAGQNPRPPFVARVRAWLERRLPAPGREQPGHLHGVVKAATTGSKTSGSQLL